MKPAGLMLMDKANGFEFVCFLILFCRTLNDKSSPSVVCQEPGSWLSLSGRIYLKTQYFSSPSFFLFVYTFVLLFTPRVPYYFHPHSLLCFLYTPQCKRDCHPSIRYLPFWKWTAAKEMISLLSGESASAALSKPLFIIDKKYLEAVKVGMSLKFNKSLLWFLADPIRRGSWLQYEGWVGLMLCSNCGVEGRCVHQGWFLASDAWGWIGLAWTQAVRTESAAE